MSKCNYSFQRKEKKYLLTEECCQQLRRLLATKMIEDQYGLHTIASIYYDTADFEMIRKSLEKPTYREKFRLRSYGTPNQSQQVFLEIKKKTQGIVYKRRLSLAYGQVASYLNNPQSVTHLGVEQQISHEIAWLFQQKQLSPQVMIAYDRRALYDPVNPDFRITFDFNIRWRQTELDLTTGTAGQLVAPELAVLMEVKALGAYPLWFSARLAQLKIYPASFTKYGQTYQRYLYQKEDFKHVS